MKKLIGICLFAVALCGPSIAPLLPAAVAQDQDRDRMQDESAYRNNKYYKEGWKDGEHHKHKDRKFKHDEDRRAYEAGYAHGDRGDKWSNKDHDDRH